MSTSTIKCLEKDVKAPRLLLLIFRLIWGVRIEKYSANATAYSLFRKATCQFNNTSITAWVSFKKV
jgi:hypothetical protein